METLFFKDLCGINMVCVFTQENKYPFLYYVPKHKQSEC